MVGEPRTPECGLLLQASFQLRLCLFFLAREFLEFATPYIPVKTTVLLTKLASFSRNFWNIWYYCAVAAFWYYLARVVSRKWPVAVTASWYYLRPLGYYLAGVVPRWGSTLAIGVLPRGGTTSWRYYLFRVLPFQGTTFNFLTTIFYYIFSNYIFIGGILSGRVPLPPVILNYKDSCNVPMPPPIGSWQPMVATQCQSVRAAHPKIFFLL